MGWVRVTVPIPLLAKTALSSSKESLRHAAVPMFQLTSLVFQLPVPAPLFQTSARE